MTDAVDKATGSRPRPEFRNILVSQLAGYDWPPGAIVSILHRISGAVLFLVGTPFILYLLQQSLLSEISFEHYRAVVSHWFTKLVLLGLAWAFLHHLCAGVRHLFLDLDIGTDRASSQNSARIVLIASLVLTLIAALLIFGVL